MESNLAFGKLPRVLSFPFKGEGAFGKLAIAALVMLAGMFIPIVPTIFLLGYIAEVVRSITVEGKDAEMPAWTDWGKLFNEGLKLLGAALIVVLPMMLVFIVLFALYFVPIMMMSVDGGEEIGVAFMVFLFFMQMITIFFSVIVGFLAGLFQPIYMAHMLTKGNFGAMFEIGQWWKIFKSAFWEFMIAFVLFFGLSMAASYIYMLLIYSIVCCCLAPFAIALIMAYLMLVYAALVAHAYKTGAEKAA